MTRLADLLDRKRKKTGMNYQQLSGMIGVSAVYVSQSLRGLRVPKDAILVRLSEALGLDASEVLRLAHYEKAPESARPFLRRKVALERYSVREFENVESYALGHGRRVPVLGWVQAGAFAPSETGDLSPANPEDFIYSDIKGRHLFALRVENDSMEPVFHPGDILVVNPNLKPGSGDYVIARLKSAGEVTFKKLYLRDKMVILKPLNPRYDDIILKPSDDFELIGRVVERKTIF